MSARDENKENQASTPTSDFLTNGVHRRNFLKYLAGAFSAAAMPEIVAACTTGGEGGGSVQSLETGSLVDFSQVPMVWVTRKQDGLSLGFQFVNLVADGNHNIALASGASSGSAYVAVTFPPQHVMEDALAQGTTFYANNPVHTAASGTSRLVFNVPTTYGVSVDAGGVGTFPYNLQGVLDLCALSSTVVAANAMSNAGTTTIVGFLPLEAEERKYHSLSQARIDRVIARVDPAAANRVQRRAFRAGRMLNRTLTTAPALISPIHTVHYGTAPAAPTNGQTSIELPYRLQMSPNETVRWAFSPTPVTSPSTSSLDTQRTELWHARPGPLNAANGLADPLLGGLTMRALWTRDYNIWGDPPTDPADGGLNSTYANEPVLLANPTALNRDAIVQQTGNMAASNAATLFPPLNVDRLMLTPVGGTLDVKAYFPNPNVAEAALQGWVQHIALGRDESVQCVNTGYVLPFGHKATLVTVNKRADDPTQGNVGVLYFQQFLVIHEDLVSWVSAPNQADYNTFPFRAVQLTQTEIAIPAGHPIAAGSFGWVYDPTGSTCQQIGAVGTDWGGNPIKFTTPLFFVPSSDSISTALSQWSGNLGQPGLTTSPPVLPSSSTAIGPFLMNRQRIALAEQPNGTNVTNASSYSADATTFEVVQFYVALKAPSAAAGSSPTVNQLVPVAQNIQLAVEAFRHLQSSPTGGTPNVDATYEYDGVVYAANGFSSANPNEIFLTQSNAANAIKPPGMNYTNDSSKSGGLVAPALNANALSRSTGAMSGTVSSASSALLSGNFDPSDYFGAFTGGGSNLMSSAAPKLFGFVPLQSIIQGVESGVNSLASEFMPKSVTQALSNAEKFLQEAMSLYNLISGIVGSSGSAGQVTQVLGQITNDLSALSQLAQGVVPSGGASVGGLAVNPGAPLTNAQKQAAAWLQSAATQAQLLIQQYVTQLTNAFNAAEAVVNDITSLDFDSLINTDGTGDLQVFITDLQALITDFESLTTGATDPQTASGAVLSYFGPLAKLITDAVTTVNGFLTAVGGVLTQLLQDLSALAQGLDMVKNLSVDFNWKPLIAGVEFLEAIAFIPSTNRALMLDINVNANSNNGPVGLNLTCRLDSFAICFGQGIPQASSTTDGFGVIDAGYSNVINNADVSLVFDHMQVQMLAGQKPDVDCVFGDIYFGGDLAFIETIKNLIPLDSFSDPPFVNVTSSGIQAGFSLGIPNIALGMFSIQNINISAALTIPWLSSGSSSGFNGITFEFDFCTIDNPFVVTVSMLGGGGFFGMTLDMKGLQRIQFGVEVSAQLSIDLVIASGSVSIEVGIFLVYQDPTSVPGWNSTTNTFTAPDGGPIDPVTGEPLQPGWLIGGYLRLRGELDVCGIITISIELYLEITYNATTGKCVASGFIAIDVSLFFFSINAKVSFSRQFAGSNGDPTFAELMMPGGVDPMIDPTLTSTAAGAVWDPFAEYCMAFAA